MKKDSSSDITSAYPQWRQYIPRSRKKTRGVIAENEERQSRRAAGKLLLVRFLICSINSVWLETYVFSFSGKDRNLNIVELLCQQCTKFFHESCIGYQLGKLLPFSMNYSFVCKNCSPTGLETYRKSQASKLPQSMIQPPRDNHLHPLLTTLSHYTDVHHCDREHATGER